MTISAKELRTRAAEVIRAVKRGEEVVVTYRGKPAARIVPLRGEKTKQGEDDELFGIWSDYDQTEDVAQYIDKLRGGRFR